MPAALYNSSLLGRPPDGAEDRQGRAGGDAAAPATMITAMADRMLWVSAKVRSADARATYTSQAAMRSAILWMGARDCSAFSTASMILPKIVSAPSFSVLTSSMPDWLMVPANRAPGSLSTGTDSPVMLDWSTVEWPSNNPPSTGISAAGRMTTTSPD